MSAALAVASSDDPAATLETEPLSTSRAHGGFSGSPRKVPILHEERALVPASEASLSASVARGEAFAPNRSIMEASSMEAKK